MNWSRQRCDEVRVACMLLTRLPVGQVGTQAPSLAKSCWAFPLVGLAVGFIAWLVFTGAMFLGFPPGVAAVSALCATALVTGGLHYDGLADFVDGVFGGRDRDHCLEIMRDSRIGTYGVLALVFVIAIAVQAIANLAPMASLYAAFIVMAVASRLAILAVLIWLPAARSDGLGQMASSSGGRALVFGVVLCGAVSIPLGLPAIPVLVCIAVVAALLGLLARRRIGGQTGDVLGAVQVVSETAGWTVLLVVW